MSTLERATRPAWLERKTVTVCIAAACDVTNDPKIVVCSDKLSSSSVGKSETRLKIRYLNGAWSFMGAGTDTEINALHKHVSAAFTKQVNTGPIDETNALAVVRSALEARKREMVEEYVRGRFAISYADFLATAKDAFTSEIHREALYEIREMRLGAECILCGFQLNYFPIIIQADQTGRAHLMEDFAVCGEGDYLAQSVLMNRAQRDVIPLDQTLYTVWEAKKYAEGASSVGEQTNMIVMTKEGGRHFLNVDGVVKLAAMYEKLGPQPLPKVYDLSLEAHFTKLKTPDPSAE